MTSPETAVLRQRLTRVIQHGASDSTGASDVAAVARRTQDQLIAVFAPLISSGGVEALSARAFDLARREYPPGESGVESSGENAPAGEPFGEIRLWLERQAPSVAVEAAAAMFATFAELLATLIGETLTMRYLEKAWPDAVSDAQTKGKKA